MNHPTPDAKSVFGRAAEIPSPAARAAFLDEACAGHPAVRAEVEALLKALGAAGSFMGSPAAPDLTGAYEDTVSETEGTVVGPYMLRELIGEGGMGLVFVAEQTQPVRRKVALKVIKPGMDTRQVVARFEAERQALALMDHPHIAKVLDAGTTSAGRPYFVMELVRGVPITEYCDANNLTPKDRLALFVQVCQAVQHAHMKGVIHRDLKPSNILVAPHDGIPVVKVIDFGVAKAVGQSLTEKTIYTRFAQMIGTPLYMSPEQAEVNQLDVDTRSDVYSLGVLLYELLTGTTPFDGDRFRKAAFDEVRRIIREEEPPRPSTRLTSLGATLTAVSARRGTDPARLAGLVRGELDWIVMKCLEKDRTRRYDSAAGLAKDVQRYLSGDAVEACPPTIGYRLRKVYRRNRAAVWVTAAFAGLVVGAAVMGGVLAVQATRAEHAANENAARATENEEAARKAEADALAERDKVTKANAELRRATEIQHRTRYAAEMNLLQAAFEAKDLARVRRLLAAQVPQPGEDDLRGPEWHYWDRTFHGYEREWSMQCPPPRRRLSFGYAHELAYSPDGRTAVVVTTTADGGFAIQARDAARGDVLKQITVPPDRTIGAVGADFYMHFDKGGRRFLLQRYLDDSVGPGTGEDYTSWLVDLDAGTCEKVEDRPRVKWEEGTRFVSDDLQYVIDFQPEAKSKQTVFVVRRLSDKAEVGRVAVPGQARAWLAPDRQHVLVFSFPDTPTSSVAEWRLRQRAVVSYWKLGAVKPLWAEESLEAPGAAYNLKPDGEVFRRLVVEDESWALWTWDMQTGRVRSSVPVVPTTRAGRFALSTGEIPSWRLSADGRRIALQAPDGLVVCDLGLVHSQSGRRNDTVRYEFGALEGAPREFAFLRDGRLVAAWTPFDLRLRASGDETWSTDRPELDRLSARVWALPPFGAANDKATRTLASADGRLFAFCPRRRVGPTGSETCAERLCVLDVNGQCVFEKDLGEVPGNENWVRWVPHVGFSADARYVYVMGRSDWRGGSVSAQLPFTVWELSTGKEVVSLQPAPGTRFVCPPFRDKRLAPFSPDGTRIVLTVAPATDPVGDGTDRMESPALIGARVVEFPSGKPVCEFAIPPGVLVRTLEVGADVITGHSLSNWSRPVGTKVTLHRWNARTGAPLEPGERVLTEDWKSGRTRDTADRWMEHGARAVHVRGSTVEVWDAARRGPGDRPLFTYETDGLCELSPDGTRLVLIWREERRQHIRLICTATGREVLSLPRSVILGFAWWSPDGGQFWYGVDSDGKPVGWDFRPRVQGNK